MDANKTNGNPVAAPNPYGATTVEGIEQFEKQHGLVLPSDYREYLLENNGGEFSRTSFQSNDDPDVEGNLHHMLGLHEGPEYQRLQEQFRLFKHYDLYRYKRRLTKYFVFADTGTGSQLLLNLETFQVCVFQPEDMMKNSWASCEGAIHVVAESFAQFVEELMTFDDFLVKALPQSEREEFLERLRQAGIQSGLTD